jgi:pimeloyl-ACP methyl ester carboxylesterase
MKQNLILLHGALGSSAQFQILSEQLKDQFTIHTFNFSGHGGKEIPDDFSISLFVNDTIDFMNAHQLAKAAIFGYSMGGYVALKLALLHPDRVERIMTLGTKFLWNPEAAAKEVRMMNPDIIGQKLPQFAATLAERHAPADWKTIMRKTAAMMTLLGDGLAMTTGDFNRIGHDVLVSIGSDDHMVSINESRDTANALPRGQLKILDGFKHPLEAVDQGTLARLIVEYFSSPH